MRTRPVVAVVSFFVLAACGSKLGATAAGTGGAGATSTGAGGTPVSSTGSTGAGATTTAQSSGAGGSGGAATTTASGPSGSTSSGTGAGGSCATTPKFKEVLAKPLSGCAGLEPPCHKSGAGGLTINGSAAQTWAQLVNVTATIPGAGERVVPGDPAHSFLYRKLTNDLKPSETPPMPEPGGIMPGDAGWNELPASEIEMVRCWILGGAKDN